MKIFTKLTLLSLIVISILYARSLNQKSYHDMNTYELQKEVEKLSQNGELPFNMGLELMKRWTKKS